MYHDRPARGHHRSQGTRRPARLRGRARRHDRLDQPVELHRTGLAGTRPPATEPHGRGALHRPRPLQGRERQPRARARRRARRHASPTGSGTRSGPATSSRASAATSSWCCATTSRGIEAVSALAERLLAASREPISLTTDEVFVTASIGIAVSDPTATRPPRRSSATPTPRCTRPRTTGAPGRRVRGRPPRIGHDHAANGNGPAPRARTRRARRALPADRHAPRPAG